MRTLPLLLTLILAACGGNGGSIEPTPTTVRHVPEISNLQLSPDSALYMEGDGSVQVTAELRFRDSGQDIETLHVSMSNGTSLAISIAELADTVFGTLTASFDVSTANADGYMVEVWIVDKAGQSSNHLSAAFAVMQPAPEISNLTLSPNSALHLEGDGSVVVTVEITFWDSAQDIQSLWIRMPDGATVEFEKVIATATGSFIENFTMSTEMIGAFTVEFWLEDKAGNTSAHVPAVFYVIGNVQSGDWTSRLSGLPGPLYDVAWDGQVFIAVGYGGAIWTSVDGIDWVARQSGTESDLWAVATYGPDIFAVGAFVVLLSTDHGETWVAKARPDFIALTAVAVNASQVIAIGGVPDLFFAKIMISEDRGDTWRINDFFAWATDLVFEEKLFVATTMSNVLVSSDGNLWNDVLPHEWTRWGWLRVVIHDGSQFIVAGDGGTVFSSLDAFNWTKLPTPFEDVDYHSAAWNGSRLVLAGGASYQYWQNGIYRPIGISSTDGGASWEVFDIDEDYQSYGIAWGNGRFVSVGWTLDSYGGAIYTTE